MYASHVDAHLSKHFNCLVEDAGLHVFRHWQEMSSTVEDTQQSESVVLSEGKRRIDKVRSHDTTFSDFFEKRKQHHINQMNKKQFNDKLNEGIVD